MRQPQRSQPSRSARLAAGALSSTTLPEVLEHSTLRLSDIMRSSECIAGEGILVKLFPVSPKYIQSVGDSKRTLWIVSSRDASNEFPSKWEDTQKSKAKTSQLTKAGSLDERTAKAKVTNGRAESRRPLVRGKRKPLMSDEREKGDGTETDDPSDEEEEDAESDNDEEVGEDGDGEQEVEEEEEEEEEEEGDAEDEEAEDEEGGDEEAGEEEVEEEEGAEEDGTENHNAAKDVTTVREAAEDVENEHDAEERDDDRNDGEHNEAQTKEADKRKDKDDSGEEDKEKDAQGEKEREKEAEREHAAEEAGDNIEKPGGTKEKDSVDEDEQAEENEDEDDEMPGEESGNRDEVREDKETMEQRVAANNRDGAWRGCRLGNMTDKEGEGRDIGSDGEERMAGENDGDSEERRKRPLETCEAFDCPTPGDRPNKRSKGDDSESEDTSATDHLTRRPFSSETTPRPRTPSPTFITASPSSAITIVRQTSAVPGLEDTEKAVWDAAHRDSVICLLPLKQQTKMVRTALSLGSEGGIKALQHFVYNARRNGWRKVKPLESNFDLSAPHSGVDVWHTTGALVPRDSGLAHFSALYQQIDFIDNKATLFSITKRVKLAAMAQYRKGLLQEDAGKNQARDVNLYLFRAIYPDHATIERPDDKATKSRARDDWNRLRDRLREGRLWLEVRDLFGGVGAFLALPPQCVPDRHVVKMPAKTFESWLRLLDVAWRALDAHARLTLNDLVRMSLAGQSLPEGSLMLEMLEDGTDTAPISLSGMLTGWPAFDRNSAEDEGGLTATLTQHEEDGDTAIPGTPLITASTTSKAEEARDGRLISQEGMMGDLEDGLFNGLDDRDLDECLN
jgi:hypothetical protein